MTQVLTVTVWLAALAVTVWPGAWLTGRLLAHVDARDRAARAGAEGDHDGVDGPRVQAVLRGGRWIGVLERLAVTGCVLVGFTAGVAVVVAVKGLGRFPQLRDDPAASERFVIGSLASLLWAGAVGFAGLGALGLLD